MYRERKNEMKREKIKVNEYGLNEYGLYVSRYHAQKNESSDKIIVKVEGGYKAMSAEEYNIWRKQK